MRLLVSGVNKIAQYAFELPLFITDVMILVRTFSKLDPEILYINNGGYPGARSARAAVFAARLSGIKIVVMRVHNLAITYKWPHRWLDFLTDFWISRMTTRFVVGSQASAEQLRKVLKLKSKQVQVIMNGFAPTQQIEERASIRNRLLGTSTGDEIVIGVVGALEERKGHRVLCSALAIIRESNPTVFVKIRVFFIGEGVDEDLIATKCEQEGLMESIKFIGQKTDAVSYINALDILAVPSLREEDTPNVVLEAMFTGTSIIASDIAGIPEQIIHGTTGTLVPAGDVLALADALIATISAQDKRNSVSVAARERFRRLFTMSSMVDSHLVLFAEMSDRI